MAWLGSKFLASNHFDFTQASLQHDLPNPTLSLRFPPHLHLLSGVAVEQLFSKKF
jgi:hypothetical protein